MPLVLTYARTTPFNKKGEIRTIGKIDKYKESTKRLSVLTFKKYEELNRTDLVWEHGFLPGVGGGVDGGPRAWSTPCSQQVLPGNQAKIYVKYLTLLYFGACLFWFTN